MVLYALGALPLNAAQPSSSSLNTVVCLDSPMQPRPGIEFEAKVADESVFNSFFGELTGGSLL